MEYIKTTFGSFEPLHLINVGERFDPRICGSELQRIVETLVTSLVRQPDRLLFGQPDWNNPLLRDVLMSAGRKIGAGAYSDVFAISMPQRARLATPKRIVMDRQSTHLVVKVFEIVHPVSHFEQLEAADRLFTTTFSSNIELIGSLITTRLVMMHLSPSFPITFGAFSGMTVFEDRATESQKLGPAGVLVQEWHQMTLQDFLEQSPPPRPEQVSSAIVQAILAIGAMQCAGIVHNDLHSDNVMVSLVDDPEDVILYRIPSRPVTCMDACGPGAAASGEDEKTNPVFALRTHGVRVIIIDFGHSTIISPDDQVLISVCSSQKVGLDISHTALMLNDFMLLLVSIYHNLVVEGLDDAQIDDRVGPIASFLFAHMEVATSNVINNARTVGKPMVAPPGERKRGMVVDVRGLVKYWHRVFRRTGIDYSPGAYTKGLVPHKYAEDVWADPTFLVRRGIWELAIEQNLASQIETTTLPPSAIVYPVLCRSSRIVPRRSPLLSWHEAIAESGGASPQGGSTRFLRFIPTPDKIPRGDTATKRGMRVVGRLLEREAAASHSDGFVEEVINAPNTAAQIRPPSRRALRAQPRTLFA